MVRHETKGLAGDVLRLKNVLFCDPFRPGDSQPSLGCISRGCSRCEIGDLLENRSASPRELIALNCFHEGVEVEKVNFVAEKAFGHCKLCGEAAAWVKSPLGKALDKRPSSVGKSAKPTGLSLQSS